MNQKWINYCIAMQQFFLKNKDEIEKIYSNFNLWKFDLNDSKIEERIMRLWIEAKLYELDTRDRWELERVAIATLKEDYIKNWLNFIKQNVEI